MTLLDCFGLVNEDLFQPFATVIAFLSPAGGILQEQLDNSGLGLSSTPEISDAKPIMTGCSFMGWGVFSSDFFFLPNHEKRLAWFSIAARILKGHDLVHMLLERKKGYSAKLVDEEIALSLSMSGPRTCNNIDNLRGDNSCKKCPFWNKNQVLSPVLIKKSEIIETESTGFWVCKLTQKGEPIPVRPAFEDLAKCFEREHSFVSMADSGNIFIHKDNFWEIQESSYAKAFAQRKMMPRPRENQRNEFLSLLKITNLRKPDWFNSSTDSLINLQNGIFSVQTGELRPHAEDYGFRYILPYSYDPNADCPRFKQFLKEVTQDRQDLIDVITEFMGYSIANGPCNAEKAMILYGEGQNGKSKLMDTWKALAGDQNYSSLALSALNDAPKRYMVDGKLFNMGEETNIRALADSEVFKTMVTGGEIDIKKLYCQPYSIKNRCKLVMACNTLPKSSDRTHGLYRRMILIPFDAKFSDEIGNRDPNIIDKLLLELPGIFNLALEGYQRLIKNQYRFTKSQTIDRAIEEYKLENDNILMWFKDKIKWTEDEADWVYKDHIYDDYKKYVESSGGFKVNKISFFKTMKSKLPRWLESKRVGAMGSMRVLLGVKMGDFLGDDED